MSITLDSVYISVKDMNRAIGFYEDILEQPVSERDARMSAFEINNLSLLLYNSSKDNYSATYGTNTVPVMKTTDLASIIKKCEKYNCAIEFGPEVLGKNRIFQCKDTEGNIIEFYEEVKSK